MPSTDPVSDLKSSTAARLWAAWELALILCLAIGPWATASAAEPFVWTTSEPMTPDVEEHKYYAWGVGLVLEVDQETGDRVEQVEFGVK